MNAARGARWLEVANADQLHQTACGRVIDAARTAIEQRGQFVIVLAGGTTPRGAYRLLREQKADWGRWHVYFGDERCLPADDPERNSKMARDEWLDHVPIPTNQVHVIPAELGAPAAAARYAEVLRGVAEFDLVLLGIGDDGHTASLFPEHDWGAEADAPDVLAIVDAPKPPPQRVSLSAVRLSRARQVLFLVAGAGKREPLSRWRAGEQLPASAICPPNGVDVLLESGLSAKSVAS